MDTSDALPTGGPKKTKPPTNVKPPHGLPPKVSSSSGESPRPLRRVATSQADVEKQKSGSRPGQADGQSGRIQVAKKPGIAKAASKSRVPAVDEAEILEWLGIANQAAPVQRVEANPAAKVGTGQPGKTKAAKVREEARAKPVSDDVILRSIGDRLVEREIQSFTRIGLDIKSGIVTVRGNVASKGERLLLLQILQSTPGVQKVQDGLTVERSRSSAIKIDKMIASIPSGAGIFSAIGDAFSKVNPVHAASAAGVLLLIGFLFWPRTPARPFAVFPVNGRIRLDGQPISKATIVLHPVDQGMKGKFPNGALPRGTTQDDGAFAIGTFESTDGAPEGQFVATVTQIESVRDGDEWVHSPNLLPAVYASPESSPFKVTITREKKEISLLELHKVGDNGLIPVESE